MVPSRSTVAGTILCLVLLALVAVVQVAHTHTFESDADHCPLCIVLHTIIPVAATAAAIILVQVSAPAPASEERPALLPWGLSLFTRPPPFACCSASRLLFGFPLLRSLASPAGISHID